MPTKFVLVTGTTYAVNLPRFHTFSRVADMAGRTLARAGLGLLTGSPPGVDRIASESFWAECERLGREPNQAYRQLRLPHFRRGYWLPGAGFRSPTACIEHLGHTRAWIERAIDLAAAAVMIGGRSGALGIARRFIDAGKPVLPIAFSGGESANVFHAILRTWDEAPVPGLSQAQFLRLAVPWINDTGPLAHLLLGTLAETPDIFVSYRRSDTGMAVGRLHADLVDHFGRKRVFLDLHGIVPSAEWRATIDRAIAGCKVGIVVIGPHWLSREGDHGARLLHEGDVVRQELTGLLAGGKTILPLLVDGAQLPPEHALPPEVLPLLKLPSADDRQRRLGPRRAADDRRHRGGAVASHVSARRSRKPRTVAHRAELTRPGRDERGSVCRTAKDISSCVSTRTGFPFLVPGLNCHCFAALTASASMPGFKPLTMRTLSTVPSVFTSMATCDDVDRRR